MDQEKAISLEEKMNEQGKDIVIIPRNKEVADEH